MFSYFRGNRLKIINALKLFYYSSEIWRQSKVNVEGQRHYNNVPLVSLSTLPEGHSLSNEQGQLTQYLQIG